MGQIIQVERLLRETVTILEELHLDNPSLLGEASPQMVEKIVFQALLRAAAPRGLAEEIRWIGGQQFPDITIGGRYGVEVKSPRRNSWKTIGSSIAEGTRVKGVQTVYLFYVKLAPPIGFRYRLYQECLSDAVVTHSPRYQIDMTLPRGQSLFDRMQIPYEDLRARENPVESVVNFYKQNMKPGEATWWANGDLERPSKMVVRLWNTLSKKEQSNILIKSLCLFPEVLGGKPTKYQRVNLWLATHEGIVVPNIRDLFSAGGRRSVIYGHKEYRISHITGIIISHAKTIRAILQNLALEELAEFYEDYEVAEDRWETWIHLADKHNSEQEKEHFPLREFLRRQ